MMKVKTNLKLKKEQKLLVHSLYEIVFKSGSDKRIHDISISL